MVLARRADHVDDDARPALTSGRYSPPHQAAAARALAEETGLRRILTVDARDFEVYLKGGKRFEIIPWMR
jgi:8-oxo-dGTP pyrophosphatase MutT (NUDIX family)